VVTLLAAENAEVFDLDLPCAIDELSDDHAVIMGYERARAQAWELGEHPYKISVPLAQRLQAGWTVTRLAYDAIIAKAAGARAALARIGVGAPRSTPAEIIDKFNTTINAGLSDPKIKVRLDDLAPLQCR
jgi:hypothetical protein